MKIYVAGGKAYHGYLNWIENAEVVNTVEEADLVFFAGGEDVTPSVYNQKANPTTYFNTKRDESEIAIYKEAKKFNKKCLGVCRGLILRSSLNKVNSGNA